MRNGWIKLHRGLLEHGIFQDAELLQVWIYCLLQATYQAIKLPLGRQFVCLQPGQLLYGRKQVSQRLHIGEGKLRGILQQLEEAGSITVESNNRYSIISIVHWQQYQQLQEGTIFPFDCDFWEEDAELISEEIENDNNIAEKSVAVTVEERKTEPTEHQLESQSASCFAQRKVKLITSKEPTENHKQEVKKNNNKIITKTKYKIKREINVCKNENKSKCEIKSMNENKEKNDRIENEQEKQILNIKHQTAENQATMMQTKHQNIVAEQKQGRLSLDQRNTQPVDRENVPNSVVFADYSDGQAQEIEPDSLCAFAPACLLECAMDDAALQEAINLGDTQGELFSIAYQAELQASWPQTNQQQIAMQQNSSHPFAVEMLEPDTLLADTDLAQLERLFFCAQRQEEQMRLSAREQELQRAQEMFDQLWKLYPQPQGYHKVTDAQKLKLLRLGYDTLFTAIGNYWHKVRRIPRQYWMHGHTFFNGGYMDYLPEAA